MNLEVEKEESITGLLEASPDLRKRSDLELYNAALADARKRFKKEHGRNKRIRLKQPPFKKLSKETSRNDLCPCGSGKKYKKCCGNK